MIGEATEDSMQKSKLHKDVLRKFIEKLKSDESFDDAIADDLSKVLSTETKVKPNDLVSIFCKKDAKR